MSLAVMGVAAWLLYAFDLLTLGWALVPFAANLVLFGWTLGLVALAIILRFGGRWQILAWSLPFVAMPVSCVFYPQAVLPPRCGAIAARAAGDARLRGHARGPARGRDRVGAARLGRALNLVYLALAAALVAWVLRIALERGLLPKIR